MKKMTIKEPRKFKCENYYRQIGFTKKSQLLFNETSENKIYYQLQLNL